MPRTVRTANEVREASRFRLALVRFMARSDQAVREAGLTPQRYLLLLAIKGSRGERLTIGDLSELLRSAQSTVTELVDRCEKAGLVARGGAPDGRVVTVALTERGDELFRTAFAAVRDDRERLMAHLSGSPD